MPTEEQITGLMPAEPGETESQKSDRQIADLPITHEKQDALLRTPFAKHLAKFLAEWSGDYSLVVALHGPWGSGKSSVKNLTVEALESIDGRQNIVVNFNPWRWSGQDQITTAFFQEVGSTIGESDPAGVDAKELETKWTRYGARFSQASSLAGALKLVGLALAPLDGGITAIVATGTEQATKLAAGQAEQLAKTFASKAEHIPTLEKLKQDLVKDLGDLKEPILIVIDDIDRLTPDELKQLFGLVKANADLPNLIFLLLFQRDTVAESLAKALSIPSGDQYLKKIIQIEFDIPMADPRSLRSALTEGIRKALSDEEQAHLELDRLNLFLDNYSQIFFQTLRDIYRFATTLKFHASLLRTTGALEVNAVDLIILEALRLQEPRIYQAISHEKGIFAVTRSQFELGRDEFADAVSENWQRVNSILGLATDAAKDRLESVMAMIFPLAMHMTDHEENIPDFDQAQMHARRRICDEKSFDNYFYFAVPAGQVTYANVQAIIDSTTRRAEFKKQLEQLHIDLKIAPVFQEVSERIEEIQPENRQLFLTGLFDTSDFSSVEDTLRSPRPFSVLLDVVTRTLELIPEPSDRVELYRKAVQQATGLKMPAYILARQLRDQEEGEAVLFPSEELNGLKDMFVNKIRTLAGNNQILQVQEPFTYLVRWSEWGDSEEIRAWVNKLLSQPRGCLLYLKAFVYRVKSGKRVNKQITTFVDVNTLSDGLKKIPREELTPDEESAVDAFVEAEERGDFKHLKLL